MSGKLTGRRRAVPFVLWFGVLAVVQSAAAQGRTDVIRGHVSDDSGHAIPHAQIAVTRAPDRRSLFAETGPDGNYELSFPDGTGDYLVHIAAPGMNEFRKRITRAGAETTFVVDAKLQSTVATLEAVRVKARAIARLERGDTFGSEFAETPALGSFQASLTPSQAGDLDAAAATQPGIRALPGGGISAHGLSADQSTATLNGMAFDASFLPRDVGAEVRVGSSPYDASIGGYSGTEVAARINPGTWLTQKTAHITLDAPPMQLGLQSPAGNSPRFTSVDAGFGRTGEIVERVWNYRAAAQGVYRTTPIMSFGDGAGGLSPDARTTVDSALSQAGVRARGTNGLDRAQLGRGSVVLQLDRTRSQRVSLSEIFYAGVTSATGAGVNALASTASAISDHGMNAFNEFQRSEYFADRRGLNETRLAMNFMSHTRDASRTLPSGTVLVQSGQSDTARNFVPVSFGGPRGPLGSSNLASLVLRNETTRMSMSGIHHLKLAAEAGFERANLRDETN